MLKDKGFKIKLLLFFMAFLLYANTIGHDYAWDDSIVITENPRVKLGIKGIPDLFVKYHSQYKADKYGYRPIVLTTFAIEYGLFKDKPGVSHFMNVFYFALLCAIMFEVLKKLFYKFKNLIPFLITVLFMVHPVHVEAVANIKSRDEIFALLFGLLSLNSFLVYNQNKQLKNILFSVVWFILAMLSKESAFVFVFIIPLALFYVQENSSLKKLVKPLSIILVLLAIGALIIQLAANSDAGKQVSEGAGIYHEGGLLGNSFFYTAVWSTKIANAFTVLLLYLKNFFLPIKQIYFYGYNVIPVANWSNPVVWLSVILNVFLFGFAIIKYKKHSEISFGILFYFISISIYTHLFITLADTMADRFLFAPSLGLCIALIFGADTIFKLQLKDLNVNDLFLNFKPSAGKISSAQKYFRVVFVTAALLLCLKTYTRNQVWKNDFTLTSHDMPLLENCSRAHNYYADNLKKKLAQNYTPALENEMIEHYKKSIAISKEAYYAYLALATYYTGTGNYKAGMNLLDSMLVIYHEQADPNYYMGEALYKTGNYTLAKTYLEKSLRLAPEVLVTYYTLSMTLSKLGEYQKALELIAVARKKFSDSSYIFEALGLIYFEMKDLEKSTAATLEIQRFGADPRKVYGAIIGRYQIVKQDSMAKKYYQEAVAKGIFAPGGN